MFDQLQHIMLQILAEVLARLITALFNTSLQSGEVTQGWRNTIIYPEVKAEDPEDAARRNIHNIFFSKWQLPELPVMSYLR